MDRDVVEGEFGADRGDRDYHRHSGACENDNELTCLLQTGVQEQHNHSKTGGAHGERETVVKVAHMLLRVIRN